MRVEWKLGQSRVKTVALGSYTFSPYCVVQSWTSCYSPGKRKGRLRVCSKEAQKTGKGMHLMFKGLDLRTDIPLFYTWGIWIYNLKFKFQGCHKRSIGTVVAWDLITPVGKSLYVFSSTFLHFATTKSVIIGSWSSKAAKIKIFLWTINNAYKRGSIE